MISLYSFIKTSVKISGSEIRRTTQKMEQIKDLLQKNNYEKENYLKLQQQFFYFLIIP